MALSDHDKVVLQRIGTNPYGNELVAIIDKMRKEKMSFDSIERNADYGPQVEGRILFREFVDELITALTHKDRVPHPIPPTDYT